MLTTDHKKLQLVVSIALIDNHDQILISKRPTKKHLSGYWEFPGGKVEKNESPENAIIREVKEELNVDINNKCIAPLSFSEMMYNNFYVVVLLYVCRKWNGYIQPQENQKIEWIQPKDIHKYKVLPADKSFFAVLRDLL